RSSEPRITRYEWRCRSSPWRGYSVAVWQFMQRGWGSTDAIGAKRSGLGAPALARIGASGALRQSNHPANATNAPEAEVIKRAGVTTRSLRREVHRRVGRPLSGSRV